MTFASALERRTAREEPLRTICTSDQWPRLRGLSRARAVALRVHESDVSPRKTLSLLSQAHFFAWSGRGDDVAGRVRVQRLSRHAERRAEMPTKLPAARAMVSRMHARNSTPETAGCLPILARENRTMKPNPVAPNTRVRIVIPPRYLSNSLHELIVAGKRTTIDRWRTTQRDELQRRHNQ
jgi:hypothetical protein